MLEPSKIGTFRAIASLFVIFAGFPSVVPCSAWGALPKKPSKKCEWSLDTRANTSRAFRQNVEAHYNQKDFLITATFVIPEKRFISFKDIPETIIRTLEAHGVKVIRYSHSDPAHRRREFYVLAGTPKAVMSALVSFGPDWASIRPDPRIIARMELADRQHEAGLRDERLQEVVDALSGDEGLYREYEELIDEGREWEQGTLNLKTLIEELEAEEDALMQEEAAGDSADDLNHSATRREWIYRL